MILILKPLAKYLVLHKDTMSIRKTGRQVGRRDREMASKTVSLPSELGP